MKRFIKPNFKKCNLNVSATLAEFLGAPNKNATLPYLKKELQKGYKNVVFICFDGMGMYPLKANLNKDDFLLKNVTRVLRSTFPATTTCATTSLTSNTLPLEHGWLGWSVYFEKLQRNIDIFRNTDSQTGETVDVTGNSPLADYPHYFDTAVGSEYEINTVFPPYVKVARPDRNVVWNFEIPTFFEEIKKICKKPEKQFIYAYCNEPDHDMHEFGVKCKHTQDMLLDISFRLQKLTSELTDTLLIVTADHGQIDVKGEVEFYKDEAMLNMLTCYPYLEPRAVAFRVKEGLNKQFEKYFKRTYGKDFKLYKSNLLVKKGYFGSVGDKAELLGDYIAIGTYTHKIAICAQPDDFRFLGHHTSLTEEMLVPLILIKC